MADFPGRYAETEKRFVPSPAKYIHGEKWNDERFDGGSLTYAQKCDQPGYVWGWQEDVPEGYEGRMPNGELVR